MLTLYNTLHSTKEPFYPAHHPLVKMYVCGITPYDYAHLGHGRVYVTFDVLYRLLHFLGYSVTYCRNFTDIDDKLLERAQRELGDSSLYQQIATQFTNAYHEDMMLLNCLPPTYEPRVTTHIPEIIAFVKALVAQQKAYVIGSNVYYSIDSFPAYGALSKRTRDDLLAGARVQVREEKRNPLDFALWKHDPFGVSWDSPWGPGRPGWHIECSTLAYKYLGKHIDIHAGGMDLIFPHHENEIAQSEGYFHEQFARYWLHNAFVRVNQEKMSKSLGNFFTLRDIFKHVDPAVIRYYILTHHYRSPLDFALSDIEAVQKSFNKLALLFASEREKTSIAAPDRNAPIVHQMLDYLCDDLNTQGLLGVVFEHILVLHENTRVREEVYYILTTLLGLTFKYCEKKIDITPEIQILLAQRENARANRDWVTADAIRDKLIALGVEVHDQKVK